MRPRIYDCFCYFNEQELLELRLRTLWGHVDVFVIVESDFTQSGAFKGRNLTSEILAPYAEKVRYIHVRECPGGAKDLWLNENYQRNQITLGLLDVLDNDWIIVSDLDEIPNPSAIQIFNPERYIRGDFEQQLYGYKLNNRLIDPKSEKIWCGSKITTGKNFKNFFGERATSVRNWKSSGVFRSLKRFLFKHLKVQRIRSGGWHFSWVIPESLWKVKFAAMAHQEYSSKGERPLKEMRQLVEGGRDLIFPGRRYERLSHLDETLPLPVQTAPEKFQSILLADPR
jgi:beta-1,4-mannosyl-glycoprotein beta-1,4-N-acetylglucosaminyltransferase